mmetsp:Transcript_5942/g.10783  ORF Transcript_5942/g.10783 Transcript_5942/m.10783 type:complete len:180 (-) Transcript_5942:257-796(-)
MEIPPLTTGSISDGDDEVLHLILSMSNNRVLLRAVSQRWLAVCRKRFPPPVAWPPPIQSPTHMELEANQAMNKLVFSLTLNLLSEPASTVAFLDWVPSYFRSSNNRQVLHELPAEDADAAWRLACRCWETPRPSASESCELRVRSEEGQRSWPLTEQEVDSFRAIVDHRRNRELRRLQN